jgi:hypothetical protein
MNANSQTLKFSRLLLPLGWIAHIRSDGTPVKDHKRETLEDTVLWEDVVWSENGVVIRGDAYEPLLSYFWTKRKKVIN